ncbi:MAG: transaldolase [Proteobacteria bacterium]|nr:transaldolase [Pseudomonadota bacterium]
MNANTQKLQALGQSLWLDNISRQMLDDGTLARYIGELSITGLTSNPTIFENAIGKGAAYDEQIATLARAGRSGEDLFTQLALSDLVRAADLFKPVHDATGGVDGWVSLELSPLIVDDADKSIESAARLHEAAARPNLYIKIPGTKAGVKAIEESIFAGVPINVTLLFSREQYLAAAEAYLRGIERRLSAGKTAQVDSVASLFVSRWDVAVKDHVPAAERNRLGIAIARRTYKAYRELLQSARWQKLAAAGARPQRLLFGSTGTKDPAAPDTLYVEALAAPDTVNTIPDKTLLAFAEHGNVGATMPLGGGDAESVIAQFRARGIDDAALAARLQQEGADAFAKSWKSLLDEIAGKTAKLA